MSKYQYLLPSWVMLLFLTYSQFSVICFSPYAPQMALQQRDHLCVAIVFTRTGVRV